MSRGNKDLTGQVFGQLTAVAPTGERKNGYTVWRCRCACGNEALVPSRYLKNGWAADCGCVPREKRRQDLTGRRFGKLTVLADTGRYDSQGHCIWRCRCDCGAEVETVAGQLTSGYKKSCGCLSRPPVKDWTGKRFGRITVTGYAGKQGGKHYWHCRCDCGNQVEVCQSNLQSGHTRSCGCQAAAPAHLHFVEGTCLEALRSRKVFSNNTSGVRGVYWHSGSGRWAAQITFQGKTRYLGGFESLEAAARARARAEELFETFLERYDRDRPPETDPRRDWGDQVAALVLAELAPMGGAAAAMGPER